MMIGQALAERQYAALPMAEMTHMARLAKEAIRRGRLTMTLRELLAVGRAGRDLLFAFVEKRVAMVALEGAKIEPWRAMMNRADKFNAFLKKTPSVARF
ncbi:hypothetical protein [Granulicella arctica]|uniref:hypothetical protein n=1 Tax=Granulicella arctica TaxID=940613 RepID=UPI0021E0650F|nr:hypothetical protein [Granulicella arctica]